MFRNHSFRSNRASAYRAGGRRCIHGPAGWVAAWLLLLVTGCGTTTTSRVTEQLLLSDAVDAAIADIDFRNLRGQTVFLDPTYIKTSEAQVHYTQYLVSSLRQQLLAAGCILQSTQEEADIIVEPRVGALGTEAQKVTFGIPKSQELSTAASLIASAPVVPTIPEIAFGKSDLQTGAAKISIFAYFRESKEPVWQSGTRVARSNSKSTWLLGAGPLQRGSIHNGLRFAGVRLALPTWGRGGNNSEFSEPSIPLADEVHFVPRNLLSLPDPDLLPLREPEERVAETPDDSDRK